jgi:hypothetical protein
MPNVHQNQVYQIVERPIVRQRDALTLKEQFVAQNHAAGLGVSNQGRGNNMEFKIKQLVLKLISFSYVRFVE